MKHLKIHFCLGLILILISGLLSCGEDEPREISYGDGHENDNGVSEVETGEEAASDGVRTFTIEYYPIELEQLERVDIASGNPDEIDLWHLNFRGIDPETSAEFFLEVAYSPDSEVMYINVMHPSSDSVIQCETSRTDLFVDLIAYIKSKPNVFLDGSEFAFGIPGMYHFSNDAVETFSLTLNDVYIIARGTVAGRSQPEVEHVVDTIKSELLELVLSGDCD